MLPTSVLAAVAQSLPLEAVRGTFAALVFWLSTQCPICAPVSHLSCPNCPSFPVAAPCPDCTCSAPSPLILCGGTVWHVLGGWLTGVIFGALVSTVYFWAKESARLAQAEDLTESLADAARRQTALVRQRRAQ